MPGEGGCSKEGVPYWTQCSSTQSRLEVTRCRWMCRTSIVFLFVWLVSTCFTVTACQSTLCCLVHACTAMAFFTSCLVTTPLCSLSLFSSVFWFLHCRYYHIWCMVPGIHDSFLLPLWFGLLCLHQGSCTFILLSH